MKLLFRLAVPVLGAFFSLSALAADIKVGAMLPELTVTDLGECVLVDGKPTYQPWDSSVLLGSPQIVEHLAARAGIDSINKPFFEALDAAGLGKDVVQQTTVINGDDALWGTSGLIAGEVSKNKVANPAAILVVDSEGLGQQQWQLQKKSAAIAILDAQGKVLFFKEGGMTKPEIDEAVELLRSTLATGNAGLAKEDGGGA